MKKNHTLDPKKINSIPVSENHEILIDLKDQKEIIFGPPPDTPLTANDYTKIRKTVYEKLCIVQKKLPQNWRFRVYEGLRSLRVQKILFEQHYNNLKTKNPQKNDEELFNETSLLIAPVTLFNGSPNLPPHSTGGAVDLELIDSNNNLINFGMAIKDWNTVDPEICQTYSLNIPDEVIKNRMILLNLMSDQGFVNYPLEWWHFSYGDSLWAFLNGKQEAIYGGII